MEILSNIFKTEARTNQMNEAENDYTAGSYSVTEHTIAAIRAEINSNEPGEMKKD